MTSSKIHKTDLFIYYLEIPRTPYIPPSTLDPPTMSALTKFCEALYEQFQEINEEQRLWAANYIEEDAKAFKALKDDGKISFGKWKCYSVAELAQTSKGLEYIQWCLAQTWFEESKFPALFADIKRLNIKKAPIKKKTPLN